MENITDKEKISILKRQTDYSEEIIIQKLKELDNNIENVIRHYQGTTEKKTESKSISTNQQIFKSIRDFMP
jgi:transposase-like protein